MSRIPVFIAVILLNLAAEAQSNQTLYHMRSLPQVMISNPANTPDSRLFIGMPGLSSVYTQLNLVGLNMGSIESAFIPVAGTDSFDLDLNKLNGIFDRESFMQVGYNHELIHFGFVMFQSLFTFSATEKIKMRADIPGDLFRLVFEGNGDANLGETFALNAALDLRHTREFAFGFQHAFINDRLRLGARVKYIYGINVIQTKKNDMYFRTEEDDFTLLLGSDLEFNAASSLSTLDANAKIKGRKYLYGARNDGWGLDLGASLDFTNKLTLSMGVIDLGFINWKENTFNLKSKNPGAEIEFKGLNAEDFFADSLDYEESFAQLGDSFVDLLELDTSRNSFTTGLFTEVYLGANVQLNKMLGLGMLLFINYYNKSFYPAATLSLNARLAPAFAGSLSYTMQKQNFGNLGFGFSINMGSTQFYVVSDNLFGVFVGDLRNVGARVGLNFTFKRTVKEDLAREKRVDPETLPIENH